MTITLNEGTNQALLAINNGPDSKMIRKALEATLEDVAQVTRDESGNVVGLGVGGEDLPLLFNADISMIGQSGLNRYGPMLMAAASGWDSGAVESPCVWYDAGLHLWAMVYTGYSSDLSEAGIGLATAPHPTGPWTRVGSTAIFGASGDVGSPDEAGTTGPVIWYEDGIYNLFYIGLTEAGYEGGVKTMCLAQSTNLTGTWTRLGTVIGLGVDPGWRDTAIWHANIVKRNGVYYNFFNATGDVVGISTERIGYATATAITGPWTVQDANCPLLDIGAAESFEEDHIGDPFVYRVGNTWCMSYYGARSGVTAADALAFTTDNEFPIGWEKYSANPVLSPDSYNSLEDKYTHKPWILIDGGVHYHYYTAVNAAGTIRHIALACTGAPMDQSWVTYQAAASAQQTTSTSLVNVTQADVIFDTTGKRNIQARIVGRGNANSVTLTWQLGLDLLDYNVTATLTGSTWANSVGKWVNIPALTPLISTVVKFKSSNGTAVSNGQTQVQFRWLPA